MKDLYVLTADADAEALLRSVLTRHKALGIRPITFDVHRFPGRDSGMVKQGPELARVLVQKDEYSRLILVWDHHGSGWESRTLDQATSLIQDRLDGVTWLDRSAAIVIVPELEEWLWHSPECIAHRLELTNAELTAQVTNAAKKLGKSTEHCKTKSPKELFEAILYARQRRKPLPDDFKALGVSADITQWIASPTFSRMALVLRHWFASNTQ